MVNHGVSRACRTCKKRRKKCDEQKPTCNRCALSGRQCLGYEDDNVLFFRNYAVPSGLGNYTVPTHNKSTIQDGWVLEAFLQDFVVESADRNVSRGFFDGMQQLLETAGSDSDVAHAAEMVEITVIGNREGRIELLEDAARRYCELLRSFQHTLSRRTAIVDVQTLMVAVLLGIYEIVSSNEQLPGKHVAHVRGVCTILCSDVSPFDMAAGLQLFQVGCPLSLKEQFEGIPSPGLLCTPDSVQNLDAVLVRCNRLFSRARVLLDSDDSAREDLLQLERDALQVHEDFTEWSFSQSGRWLPSTIGTIHESDFDASSSFFHSGPVDDYLDLYVSASWNTYRKTHIMLLDIMYHCSRLLWPQADIAGIEKQAEALFSAIVASIPFHLTRRLESYVEAVNSGASQVPAGRPAGGLLLLHPLYAAGRCSIVPRRLRNHMGMCLDWISKNMGIGQAHLLSKAVMRADDPRRRLQWTEQALKLPFQQMSEGHILIWAGMLLEPR